MQPTQRVSLALVDLYRGGQVLLDQARSACQIQCSLVQRDDVIRTEDPGIEEDRRG